MTAYDHTNAESDTVVLQLRDANGVVTREIDTFREYSFNNHFLTPTDSFSFTIGDEVLRTSIREGLFIGQNVTLSVNGYVQASGYIEHIKVQSSRSAGTELVVEGRDRLCRAVNAHIDPGQVQFQVGMSLQDVILAVFGPFGWSGLNQIQTDDDYSYQLGTGQLRGTPTSKKGKPLKSYLLHQFKPYLHEGCFEFASRISQRYGLWIWPSADGGYLTIGKPDFTQKPIYNVVSKTDDTSGNNVISSEVSVRADNQPSVIVATGFTGGGEWSRQGLIGGIVNELTGLDDSGQVKPEVQQVLQNNLGPNWPTAMMPLRPEVGGKIRMPFANHAPMFLHDDESKTQEQLNNFLLREMALKQREAFSARYVFEGHSLAGVTWFVNAMANVDDDIQDIHTSLWVIERTFMKSRSGGTSTHVSMILPHTLRF